MEDLNLLKEYITEDEPFGPENAAEIEDLEVLKVLFESHNRIYKTLPNRPSIVTGRKGAGKTSYLNSAFFDTTYKHVVEISTPKAFSQVIESIEKASKSSLFPETVADLWETVLGITFLNGVRDGFSTKANAVISAYLAKVGVRDKSGVDDVLWTIADTLAEKSGGKAVGVIAEVFRKLDNSSYSAAREAVQEELKKDRTRALILLDSLEEFRLDIDSVSLALQGLLKCIGRSNKPSDRVDIRFCLPAELFHKFQEISSNPNKDFRREILLHWTSPELWLVAANRLNIFLELFHPELRLHSKSIDNRKTAKRLVENIFTTNVEGRLGVVESPLAYIMRHTQLLPRHLIIILNSIWKSRKRNGEGSGIEIGAKAIIEGVMSVEQKLVREIFVAYKAVYPLARRVCESCFPEIEHVFSIGDLERVFRTHGKRAFESDDFFDFKRMLIEIGAVGRVVEESEKYVQAIFEYTVPHTLVTGTDDRLCLHPLFTEVFSAKTRLKKPIYPYGCLLEDPDYRAWD